MSILFCSIESGKSADDPWEHQPPHLPKMANWQQPDEMTPGSPGNRFGLPTNGDLMKLKVKFKPLDLQVEVEPGTSLLAAARQAGIDLESDCGGMGRFSSSVTVYYLFSLAAPDSTPPYSRVSGCTLLP